MKLTVKFVCFALCLILAALPLASCSDSQAGGDGDTITVTDHNGDTVTVPKDIQRIVVCDIFPLPSVLAVFFDSAEKIVGMSPTSMSAAENGLLAELYPEITNAKTDFIAGTEVNTEELLTLDPDVVFYNATSKELGNSLKNAGFNAVAISVNKWDYDAVETLNQWIALLSEMFPGNDKGDKVRAASEAKQTMVRERTAALSDAERAKVFFLFQYSDTSITTSGKQFFGQWWADAVGAVNVAEELSTDNSVAVNLEQVYAWNPEIVFMTNFTASQPSDLYDNTVGVYDWSGVKAVKDRKVYKMPLGMYRSYTPGVDTPITLLWLAKTTYPSLFEDVDITQETISYYKDVFGVSLTKEQANSIFVPDADAGLIDFGG